MPSISFRAMGTDVQFVIAAKNAQEDALCFDALQQARAEVDRLEGILSRFKEDSALSDFNRHPGQAVSIPPELMEVLVLAKKAFEETGGVFNPCLGSVIERMGYDISFEKIGESEHELETPSLFLPHAHCPFDVSVGNGTAYLEPDAKIDLGGIGKGWIVQQAANLLLEHGFTDFLCNAGGDLLCSGRNDDTPWAVGILAPFHPLSHVLTLDIQNLSIATSGTYRRKWTKGGKLVHHIIDPFFGTPAESDLVSCSVIHRDLVQAEIYATVAIILGSEQATAWLEQQDCDGWVVIKQTGEVVKACN